MHRNTIVFGYNSGNQGVIKDKQNVSGADDTATYSATSGTIHTSQLANDSSSSKVIPIEVSRAHGSNQWVKIGRMISLNMLPVHKYTRDRKYKVTLRVM